MTDKIVDGRYRLLDRVGAGGMAEVWCAEDLQLGRQVALKLLHGRFSQDAEFVERFRREASAAAGLQHGNVVSIYDRGEYEGTYYIAMEFVDGRTLKAVVNEEGPLSPDRAIDLVLQVLRAARFAHRRGIIHRDLKPHNVIVDVEGRAKVADFGIARAEASDMTQTGSIMGTAQYLSPEQAQGHAVSPQSDIYSVGVMLYELLTGRVPFEGESAVTIALKQVSEAPVPPSVVNPTIGPALEAAVLRAMAKDASHRFADADEFIAALEAARGETATAPATTVSPAAAYVPPADATQVVPAPAYRDELAYYPPGPLPPRDDERRRWWIPLVALLVIGLIVLGALLLGGGGGVTVPRVVGLDQESAELRLQREGLSTDVRGQESSRPRGQVIEQDPAAGASADEGDTVTLTVSAGPGEVVVPDLQGRPLSEARRELRELDLEIDEERRFDEEISQNRVLETRPGEGERVERGSRVTVVVSKGRERAEVPRVVGRKSDEARRTLDDAGFEVEVKEQESDEAEPGTVIAQAPGAGSRATKGSTVTITVAREPAERDVPDVTGETQSDATERLSREGFTVRVEERPVDSPEGDGIVLEQDPRGGKAKRGAVVTITVGEFDPDLNPDPGDEQPPPQP